MRPPSILLPVFILPATLAPAWPRGIHFLMTRIHWCAVYGGRSGGASNCGFLTWQQCVATVSGIGGFCERNQFYNPRGGPTSGKKQPR